jgi:ActR/RegA family two-component response regulator
MTTLIIEDEKPAARLLQRKLEKLEIAVETMLHL